MGQRRAGAGRGPRGWGADALAVLGAPLAPWLFFAADLLGGRLIVSQDTTNFLYVLRRWHVERWLADGAVALWNPGVFSGVFQAGDPQLGLYSPLLWLYLLWDGAWAHQLYILTLLSLGGLGMTLWLRELTGRRWLAAGLGVVFVLSGPVLGGVLNAVFLAGMCTAPWVLWRAERLRRAAGPANWLWLALAVAWMVLEGDPFAALAMVAVVVVQAALTAWRRRSNAGLWAGAAALAGLALAAIAWLPALDAVAESRRAVAIPYAQASVFSFHPGRLLNALVPAMWGHAGDGTFWGHGLLTEAHPFSPRFWHASIYLGLPFVLLLLIGLVRGLRRRALLVPLGFGLLYLLLAGGPWLGLHRLLYEWLPGFDRLRFPAKFLAYSHVLLFPFMALGLRPLWDDVLRRAGGRTGLMRLAAGAAGLYAAAGLVAGLVEPAGPLGSPALERAAARLAANAWVAGGLALACGLIALLARRLAGARLRWLLGALLLVGLVDLLRFAPPLPTEAAAALDRPSGLAARIGPAGRTKVLRDANLDRFPAPGHTRTGRETLAFNWGLLEGVHTVFGYDPKVPARYDDFSGQTVFDGFETWAPVLGISHVLTTRRPAGSAPRELARRGVLRVSHVDERRNLVLLASRISSAAPRLSRSLHVVADRAAALRWIEGQPAAPPAVVLERGEVLLDGRRAGAPPLERVLAPVRRAGAAAAPPGRVRGWRRRPDGLEVALECRTPALLVLAESFHPGWRARVDGRPAPVLRADYVGMGVVVPAGARRVELRFAPPAVGWSRWVSLVAAVLLLAVAAAGLWQRRRSSATQRNAAGAGR
jgi:hypothetical protein